MIATGGLGAIPLAGAAIAGAALTGAAVGGGTWASGIITASELGEFHKELAQALERAGKLTPNSRKQLKSCNR